MINLSSCHATPRPPPPQKKKNQLSVFSLGQGLSKQDLSSFVSDDYIDQTLPKSHEFDWPWPWPIFEVPGEFWKSWKWHIFEFRMWVDWAFTVFALSWFRAYWQIMYVLKYGFKRIFIYLFICYYCNCFAVQWIKVINSWIANDTVMILLLFRIHCKKSNTDKNVCLMMKLIFLP